MLVKRDNSELSLLMYKFKIITRYDALTRNLYLISAEQSVGSHNVRLPSTGLLLPNTGAHSAGMPPAGATHAGIPIPRAGFAGAGVTAASKPSIGISFCHCF